MICSGLVAAAGTKTIAQAAREHRTPVVVVSGVYKLSPLYPFDFDALIEYGDSGAVFGYEDGDLVDKADVENPLYDYVPPELVDLYITNLSVLTSPVARKHYANKVSGEDTLRRIYTELYQTTTGTRTRTWQRWSRRTRKGDTQRICCIRIANVQNKPSTRHEPSDTTN